MVFDVPQERAADAVAAPLRQYVEVAHPPGEWIVAIRIAGESADADEHGGFESAKQRFALGIETNLAREEFIFQTGQELEAFLTARLDQGREKRPGWREQGANFHRGRV